MPLMSQNKEVTPENHPMLGEYYAVYDNKDGSKMNYKVQITPADDNFPNSLYVVNILPRYQESGSTVYSTPATIVSENTVNLELGYPIEGNVDLTLHPEVGQVCNLYLLGAFVINRDTILREYEEVAPMVLSDDGKSITVSSSDNMNALVVVPITGPVPSGPFARCIKLPLVMTTEEPTGMKDGVENMYSVYPTVTDGELNVLGFNGIAFIYDMNGNLIMSLDCIGDSHFDLSAFEAGTYILKMNTAAVKIAVK